MRVLIAAGGTAGHINPALAIAGALKKADPTAEIHFAGRKEGMEYRLVTQAGYPFHHIEITGFQRKLSLHNIKRNIVTLWNLALSGPKAKAIMKEVQPDLVIGCGGYVSGPVVRCAAKMGIHTALHEQNAFPGVTNKLLAKDVDVVFAASAAAVEKLGAPEKTLVVGNPVRPEILNRDRAAARAADQLLIDVIPAGVDVRGGYLRQLDKLLEAAIAVERTGANLVVRGIDVNIHTQLAAVCGRSIGSVDPVGRSAVVQGDAQITRIIIIGIVVINTPHKTLREGEVHAPGRGKARLPQELGVIVKRLATAALIVGGLQRAVQQLGKIEEMPRVQQLTVHGLLQRRADGRCGGVPRIQQLVGAAVGQHQRGGTARPCRSCGCP